jgi:hypothetical protein
MARFDVADPPTSNRRVHVILEPAEVPLDIAHTVCLLRFEPSPGHGSYGHTRAGSRSN